MSERINMKSLKKLIPLLLIISNVYSYECPDNLDNKIQEKIKQLVENDKNNILGLQFHITSLKMALDVKNAGFKTLEGYLKRKEKKLTNSPITKELVNIYKDFGLKEDLSSIKQALNFRDIRYRKANKRIYNDRASAYVLAKHINGESKFKMRDAAILRIADFISDSAKEKHEKYSAAHNLTNMSNRIAIYTGYINPSKALSSGEMIKKIKNYENQQKTFFKNISDQFTDTYAACFDSQDKLCKLNNLIQTSFDDFLLNIVKRVNSDSNNVEFNSLKNNKIIIDNDKFNFSFIDPKLKKIPTATPIPVPTSNQTPENQINKNENFACNGVPASMRKDLLGKAKASIMSCMTKVVTSFVSAVVRGKINYSFGSTQSFVSTKNHHRKKKSDKIEYEDQELASEDQKDFLLQDNKIADQLDKEYSQLTKSNEGIKKLRSMGLKVTNGIVEIENRDKYIDSSVDKIYQIQNQGNSRIEVSDKISSLYSNDLIPTSTNHFVIPYLSNIKQQAKNIMLKIEKFMPGLFKGKCWDISGFVNAACQFLGEFAGNIVYNGLASGGTGFVPPAIAGNIGKSTFSAFNDTTMDNIGIPFAIHGAGRATAQGVAKPSPNETEFFNNREFVFSKIDPIFQGTGTSVLLINDIKGLKGTFNPSKVVKVFKKFKSTAQSLKNIQSLSGAISNGEDLRSAYPDIYDLLQGTNINSFIEKTRFSSTPITQ